jgi:hypothetical protein
VLLPYTLQGILWAWSTASKTLHHSSSSSSRVRYTPYLLKCLVSSSSRVWLQQQQQRVVLDSRQ